MAERKDRSLSEVIAEENRMLHQKLTGSFKGYVVYSALNEDESPDNRARLPSHASFTELLSQTCVLMISKSRMALHRDSGLTSAKPTSSVR